MTWSESYYDNNLMYLLLSLFLSAVSLMITSTLVPGFQITDFKAAVLAAIVLGLVNTFIKPLLLLLTAPLNLLTLGLFTFVVNAIMLWSVSLIVHGLVIEGWLPAVLAAIVLSVTSTILSSVSKDLKILR